MSTRQLVWAALVVCLPLLPSSVAAQDAAEILRTMEERQAERWETVHDYTVTKAIEVAGGAQAPMYFEKFTTTDGDQQFRLVMPGEYSRQVTTEAGFPDPTPDQLEQMATGYEMVGSALSRGGGDMPPMPGAGMMMGDGALFLRATADARRNENDGREDAETAAKHMKEFAARARLAGRESLDLRQVVRGLEAEASGGDPAIVSWVPESALSTRDAFHLVADDLSDISVAQPEGGEFTLKRMSLWIDAEHYVPLRLHMEGEAERDGKPAPLTIEKLNLDYRKIGPLLEPFAEVFHLSGIMDAMSDKERAEMEKARRDLAEAKKQLAAMPAAQRAMAERMMRGQLEKAEKMLAGGAMVTSVRTVSLAVNEGPPTPYGLGSLTLGSATFEGALTIASHAAGEGGRVTGELAIAASRGEAAEASIELRTDFEFPAAGTSVAISDGGGWARYPGVDGVSFDRGSGVIEVTKRSDTRIAGTFSATLTGTGGGGQPVTVQASGSFDSGAPAGPDQAPRGSPFPANVTQMGPPAGSPAVGGSP